MSFPRRTLSIAALAAFSVFVCNGCHSKTQPAASSASGTSASTASNSQTSPSSPQTGSAQSGASGGAPEQSQAPPAPQAPPPPAVVALPAGTDLRIRLDQDLGSKISRAGDSFSGTIADAVRVNGQTVIPRDARAEGTVIAARPLGRFKGGAELALRLERVTTKWGSYPVATSTISRAEKGKGRRTALFAGGGAGFGALIGGLAGGGKGALIGALAGGGAGTAGSAFTGNREIFLPAETLLTFHLDHSVHITEAPQQ